MAYYAQSCNSYFMESHEDNARRYRDEWREQDRQAKHHVQMAIAEDLSVGVSSEYRDDVHQHMEKMEVRGHDIAQVRL